MTDRTSEPGRGTELGPGEVGGRAVIPAWVRALVRFMDDAIAVPGTRLRFGWDAVLGMFAPWVGDALATTSHLALIAAAFRARAPRAVFARMVLNAMLDAALGSLPIVGDAFDAAFKANRRNLELVERAAGEAGRGATLGDYAVLVLAIAGALLALVIPVAFMVWATSALLERLG